MLLAWLLFRENALITLPKKLISPNVQISNGHLSSLTEELSSSKAARSHLSSLTELSSSKAARSQKSVLLLLISSQKSLFHSEGNTPTIPILSHISSPVRVSECRSCPSATDLLRHCDPEPNTTSKSSSWKAEGQASYQSLSRLQRKNEGQLLCVCCTN
ncbi:hypothetical protein NC653_039675 [Populus alba x Populus x berolinensis]|uniref:Uncharacterized protein n=1 Tax=Populus alba x Populus x berolinensis TaxID=444605 RepID=A0AAD6LCH3_9ROSI|nr:hypothetical protein NC653_039675 [Populus alba x Populus x berolinensis]